MKPIRFTSPFKRLARMAMKWVVRTRLLAFPRNIVIQIFHYCSPHSVVISYDDPERSKVIDLIRNMRTENILAQTDNEAYQIFMAVRRTKKIDGDIAEVGVFAGATAKLICEAKGSKALHLFDTFEGIPDLGIYDEPELLHKGDSAAALEHVRDYLMEYSNVHFYKGLFPDTGEPVQNGTFSFVHLDVDIYESTLSCLKFFYPRMNKGGIIISHDYMLYQGVRKAVDSFFEDKPEPIIELAGSQCLIVKL